jgi:hypothetical protein
MLMNPPTVPADHVNAPSYDELVTTLQLIRHATSPTPDDGGHHEAAHGLADSMLKRIEARQSYEERHPRLREMLTPPMASAPHKNSPTWRDGVR